MVVFYSNSGLVPSQLELIKNTTIIYTKKKYEDCRLTYSRTLSMKNLCLKGLREITSLQGF